MESIKTNCDACQSKNVEMFTTIDYQVNIEMYETITLLECTVCKSLWKKTINDSYHQPTESWVRVENTK